MHSALVVRRIERRTDGPIETVLVHLSPVTPARRGSASGSFDYELDIAGSVNEVRFGTEATVIWRRKSAD